MSAVPEKKTVADWAIEPFKQFINNAKRLRHLLHLCIDGISMQCHIPEMVEVLQKVEPGDPLHAARDLESAKNMAALAQREVDDGFPLLRSQTIISLWSSLEATIRTFLARWLENNEQAFGVDALQKIRVRIGEYEKLRGEDKYFYILDRLEQEMSAPMKCGVTRFEVVLAPFGLSGAVSEIDRRNLFEMNHVRNVLVHRSGIADKRLADACPWLGLTPGQALHLDDAMTDRYFESSMQYMIEVIVRLSEHFGVDMKEVRDRRKSRTDGLHPTPVGDDSKPT